MIVHIPIPHNIRVDMEVTQPHFHTILHIWVIEDDFFLLPIF